MSVNRATVSRCGRQTDRQTDLQCCLHLQTQTSQAAAMAPERLPTSYTFHVLTVISKHVVINLHRAPLPVGKGRHYIMIIMYVSGLIT